MQLRATQTATKFVADFLCQTHPHIKVSILKFIYATVG